MSHLQYYGEKKRGKNGEKKREKRGKNGGKNGEKKRGEKKRGKNGEKKKKRNGKWQEEGEKGSDVIEVESITKRKT